METYDVIIVGAGPAGISTALHLQQMAPDLASRTLVLEKARYPRNKLCGGGVVPDAERVLQRLGLDVTEVPHVTLKWAQFGFEGKGIAFRHTETYAFRVVHRENLDMWLLQKARERGLTVLEETPVQRVSPVSEGVEVQTPRQTYRAKVVVGADGAHSIVRRCISGGQRPLFAYALVLWVPPNEASAHLPEVGYFDFFCVSKGIPGYVWDFPILIQGRQMRSWGIAHFGVGGRQNRRWMVQLLKEEMARHGYSLEECRLYGESVPLFQVDTVFSAPHILLAGDAIGVDGLFGEGISPALGYGEIAARAIVQAFESGDFSFQKYRADVLKSAMGRMVRRRSAFASVFYRLRHTLAQRFIWWRGKNLVEWIVKNFLASWTE